MKVSQKSMKQGKVTTKVSTHKVEHVYSENDAISGKEVVVFSDGKVSVSLSKADLLIALELIGA